MGDHHGDNPVLEELRLIAARLDCGNATRDRMLEVLERIALQQASDSQKLERLLMITEEMQAAAGELTRLVGDISTKVDELIAQGGGGDTATSDEVIGLLSPIASGLQTILDTLNAATGGTPPAPTLTARRAVRR